MFDLLLKGGTAITPQGAGLYDIAIKGEQIAAVLAPGAVPDEAARVVKDVTGKIVMPGGIDPHVHCAWHMPLPDGTATTSGPPEDVSRAALWGGTTMLIDFAARTEPKPCLLYTSPSPRD